MIDSRRGEDEEGRVSGVGSSESEFDVFLTFVLLFLSSLHSRPALHTPTLLPDARARQSAALVSSPRE